MLSRAVSILRLVIIAVAIPFLLLSSNISWVVNWPPLYSYGFEKYDVDLYTGIQIKQLVSAGKQIRDYFGDEKEFITVRIEKDGEIIPNLYNHREILHMKDVKELIKGVYRSQQVSALLIAVGVLLGFALPIPGHFGRSVKWICRGGGITLAATLFVVLLALGGFQRFFLYFHLISFSNDLWMLDPRKDFLIMMFPQGFFFDATALIVLLTLAEGLILWFAPSLIRKFWNI